MLVSASLTTQCAAVAAEAQSAFGWHRRLRSFIAGGYLITGLCVGLLTGFLTAIAFLAMLKVIEYALEKDPSLMLKLIPLFPLIPGCWFGVPWITGKVVAFQEFTDAYVVSLAVSFCAVCLYPAARWAYLVSKEIGRKH